MSCSTSSHHTGEVDVAVAVRAQEEGEAREERRKLEERKKCFSKLELYCDV